MHASEAKVPGNRVIALGKGRRSRLLQTSALAVVLMIGFSDSAAQADPTVTWTGDASTDWFDTRNWSTGAVPASNDLAEIDTTSPKATVISTNGVAEIDALLVGNSATGSLTIEKGGSLTANEVAITDGSGTGTLVVTGSGSSLTVDTQFNISNAGTGTLTVADGAAVTIGDTAASLLLMGNDKKAVSTLIIGASSDVSDPDIAPGTVTLENGGKIRVQLVKEASFIFNHNGDSDLQYTFSPSIELLDSDNQGTATINVLSGYTIFSGDNSEFDGDVAIAGGTMVVTNSFTGTGVTVGDSQGDSALSIETSGDMTIKGDIVIGNDSGNSGSITVTGSDARLKDTKSIVVGNKGTGVFLMEDGATVSADTITIANESSSTGTLAIGATSGGTASAPGTLAASELTFGSGSGILLFNHTGTSSDPFTFDVPTSGTGTIQSQTGYTALSADNSGFSGTLTVDGGTVAITGDLKAGSLTIADTGAGAAATVSNAATVEVSGDANIGVETGSSGSLAVSGATDGSSVTASTLTISDDLVVGSSGTGSLAVSNSGVVSVKGNVTLGANVGGTGSITVSGSSANTVSTLKVSKNLVVGSSGTGTLVVSDSGDISVDGGKGTVTIADIAGSTGTLAIGAKAGDTAADPGTLSAKSVAFGDGSGTMLFNHSDVSGDFEFSLPLTGDGTLAVESGTTMLSADHDDFTGSTAINGGTLSLSGTLPGDVTIGGSGTLSVSGTASGDVTVSDGGTLSGTGAIDGAIIVASGGTVAPGGSVGTLQVQDTTFQSGSVLSVEIDAQGSVDLLQSADTVSIQGGTVSVSADSYADNTSFTIVTADTAVSGAFSQETGDTATIAYSLSYDDNNVILTQAISQSFASLGETSNQLETGRTLDSLPTAHPVAQHGFGAMTEAEARRIYDSLSGEVHASLQGALMENDRHISTAVNRRLGGDGSLDAGQIFAFGAGDAVQPQNGAWVAGYGGWNDIDATANTAAADNDYGGFVAGLDRDFGHRWRFGILGAYGHTDLDQSGRASSSSADSFSAGLYGGATQGPFFASLGGVAGWHDIDTSRAVTIRGETQTLTAGYDATSWQLFGEAGYRIEHGGFAIQPFAGLSFMQIDTDGFNETGGSAALSAAANTESTTFTTLGLHLGRQLTDTVRLRGMAGWRHAFGDIDPSTTFTLAGSTPFTIAGAPIAEDALVIGAGFEMSVSDTVTLGIGYDGQFGDGSTANQIDGHLRVRF